MKNLASARRSKILVVVGVSGLAALADAQTPSATEAPDVQPPKFTLQLLDNLGSDESAYVAGINDAGEAVGSVGVILNGQPSPACLFECAVIWHGVTPTVLETQTAYGSEAYAINNSGQIAGIFLPPDQSEHYAAVVWNNGAPTLLPSPSPQYTETVADSISDAGQIVGYGAYGDLYAALEWNGGTPAVLGLAPGCTGYSIANSVNNDGIAVGVTECPVSNQPLNNRATVWNGAAPTLLGAGGFYPKAYAINNAGLIVGVDVYGATAWVDGVGRPLGGAIATAVNNLGVIVGKARNGTGYHAALWSSVSAAPQDLNTLISTTALSEYVLTEATGINGSCTIVANGFRRSDPYNSAAFLLTPTKPSDCPKEF